MNAIALAYLSYLNLIILLPYELNYAIKFYVLIMLPGKGVWEMSEKIRYWVWLSSLTKVSPKKCNQLLEYFCDPENIWNAPEMELKKLPFITQSNFEELVDVKKKDDAELILRNVCDCGIKLVTIQDESYPMYLKNIYDPPVVLYVKGSIKARDNYVAVVGSRKATSYGMKMAEDISFELSRFGITVVSGMARGIDSYAHDGALRCGGRTVAVLGCGVDVVYPSENEKLMEKIINSGAVISEYVPGMQPLAHNFPARNRIISGISLGVAVIEASDKSGSLITANFALEQGREVFAVPGNVNSINSSGTNRLIKDGAKMVTGIEDILEELKLFVSVNNNNCFNHKKNIRFLFYGLDLEEKKIAECLISEPLHIDSLAQKCGLGIQAISSILTMMELKGIIEQAPGKIFRLKE